MPAKRKQPKKKVAKRAKGRPSTFKQSIADEICSRLSKGEPLAWICKDDHMPAVRTVSAWKAKHESFSADFARARDDGYDALAAQCLDIADMTDLDTIENDKGHEVCNSEWIARSRLRVDTRLKLLAKWDPRRYGDKLELGGDDDRPLKIIIGGNAE